MRKTLRRGLTFNHAMIYTADVGRAVEFYGRLGFDVLVQEPPYYARLKSPAGSTTLALHLVEPGKSVEASGIRLYFETPRLTAICRALVKDGVAFTSPPAKQPWGWTHAYLNDPDGHEVSLYRAGKKRLKGR